MQRQPLIRILDVTVCSLTQEHLTHLEVTMSCSDVEAGAALPVLHLQQLCGSAQQETNHSNMTSQTCQVQRGVAWEISIYLEF